MHDTHRGMKSILYIKVISSIDLQLDLDKQNSTHYTLNVPCMHVDTNGGHGGTIGTSGLLFKK